MSSLDELRMVVVTTIVEAYSCRVLHARIVGRVHQKGRGVLKEWKRRHAFSLKVALQNRLFEIKNNFDYYYKTTKNDLID